MKNEPIPCSSCGAVLDAGAPGGLCPRCLMAGALLPTDSPAGPRAAPPTVEQVAGAFPNLEVLAFIGAGGMGAVFRARQPKLNRLVALKVLPASLAGRDPAFAERFEREGQMLARLHHPNIVAVYDSGRSGDFFYLLMEHVDGVNLRQAMRTSRFTPSRALAIVPRICDALQFAHDEGVLHRDIKPENILLDAKGRVKLADFGIGKILGEVGEQMPAGTVPAPRDAALTQAGTSLGTPQYMAPEQRERPDEVDHRADIYSLGVVFYELLTGELPIGKFAPPSQISATDPRVDEIVRQALEMERGRRQQSAGEVRTQVETVVNDTGAARPPQRPGDSSPRLLNTSTSYVTTPEMLATFAGQFYAYRNRCQLLLDERQLTFSRAGTTTVIPLAAIRDLSIGHYPRTMNPAGLDFISVTYEEGGQTRRLFFSPTEGWFGLPSHFNHFVADWFQAIRAAITAATGREPGQTPAGQLGVPPGSKAIYAFFLALLLVAAMLFLVVARKRMVPAAIHSSEETLPAGPVIQQVEDPRAPPVAIPSEETPANLK